MAILDSLIFRLKPASGHANPHNEIGAGEVLSGGTATLVDTGGGVYGWEFTGSISSATIPSKVVTAQDDGGGATLAVTLRRVAAPSVGSQTMVGWSDASETAGLFVRRGSSVAENVAFWALFSGQSAASKAGVLSSTLQTYVFKVACKAAANSDSMQAWVQTTGRVGTTADVVGASDSMTQQTIDRIKINPTNGGDYQIVDLVLWGRELTDAECAAVADNLRGTLDVTDTTAPTLTSPTGVATGTTTATGGATTDEANGTLYTVWTTAATTPTATQVEAGQNAAGTAAAASANTAVSSTGAKTNNATGLTASTTYYAHSMHKDAAGNRSNVVTSASFTTSAGGDVTAPVLTSPVGTQTGTSTATVGATTDEGNGTMYAVVTTSATAPSAAQVMAGQTNTGAAAPWAGNVAVSSTGTKTLGATGLTASTAYYAHLMHRDAAGNNSAVVSSASFTTAAPVTATLNFQAAGMEFGSRTGLGISTFGLENGKSYRYTVHADGLTLGAALITSAAITLDGAGKLPNLSSASLTAGTTYIVCAVRQSDGAAAIFKMVAS